MPFHKSCYTSRSSGYKYRTLSTNTGPGDKKSKRPSVQQEVSLIDQKFHNLHNDISSLISKELDDTDRSRAVIHEKVEKIEAKINSMVELRDNIFSMRQTLNSAQNTLDDLYQRVQKVEVMNEVNSVKLRKSAHRTRPLNEEEAEQEIFSSEIMAPSHASPVVAFCVVNSSVA